MGDSEYEIDESGKIVIDRIRNYFEFEDPFLINCTEEITFFNEGKKIDGLVYDLNEFKSHLDIFDRDSDRIEFHSIKVDELPKEINSGSSLWRYPISIDFPSKKPIDTEEYRTIRLKFIKEIPKYNSLKTWGQFSLSLDSANTTYVYIKKPQPNYDTKLILQIETKDGQKFELLHLYEINKIKVEDNEIYTLISISAPIKDCMLFIKFSCTLTKTLKWWLDFGVVIGYSYATVIFPLLVFNPEMTIKIGIPVGTAIITYLIITKGWIFTKDMDKIVSISNNSYNYFYLVSIFLILFELIILGIFPIFTSIINWGISAITVHDDTVLKNMHNILNIVNNSNSTMNFGKNLSQ